MDTAFDRRPARQLSYMLDIRVAYSCISETVLHKERLKATICVLSGLVGQNHTE